MHTNAAIKKVNNMYTLSQLEEFVWDGIVDGFCSECEQVVDSIEPDAADYNCINCGAVGMVDSVLVILGVI